MTDSSVPRRARYRVLSDTQRHRSSLNPGTEAPYAHLLGQDAADLDGLPAITVTTWLKVQSYTSGNHRLGLEARMPARSAASTSA